MSKVYTDEEVAKFKKVPDTFKTYTDEEVAKFPEVNKGFTPDLSQESPGVIETVTRTLDAPSSIVRAGIKGLLDPEKEALSEVNKQAFDIARKGPVEASRQAPTYEEIAGQAGLSQEMTEIKNPFVPEETLLRTSPAEVVGTVADVVADPLNLPFPGSSALKATLKPAAKIALRGRTAKNSAQALSKFIKESKFLKEGMDPLVLGARLAEEDLARFTMNPGVLQRRLVGKSGKIRVSEKAPGISTVERLNDGDGLIANVSNDLRDQIKQLDVKVKPVSPQEVNDRIVTKVLSEMTNPTSGIAQSPDELLELERYISQVVKEKGIVDPRKPPPLPGEQTVNKPLNISEVQELRKNIGSQLSSKKFYQPADQAMAAKSEALLSMYRELGDIMNERLAGIPLQNIDNIDAATYFQAQNNRLSQLMKIRGLLEAQDLKALKGADLKSTVSGMLAGGAVGGTMGGALDLISPSLGGSGAMIGAVGGVAYPAARKTYELTRDMTPAIVAAGSELAEKGVRSLGPAVPAATRSTIYDANERREQPRGRMPQSIPEQLVRTPLPRDTQRLFEMKDVVLAKIAQMAPEMVDQIAEAMQTPATFQKILPLAVARFPNLFEMDKYNRVDGKVLDPQSKELASEDIMQDPNLSVYERAQLISKMNKTGYLEY